MARYEYESSEQFTSFEFESEGSKGKISKRVQYILLGYLEPDDGEQPRPVFNLEFGDVMVSTNGIDDQVVTHNGDTEEVLATVASTAYAFFEQHPKALVHFEGSTKARTKLYRMGISKYLLQLGMDFEIMGFINGNWEKFEREIQYDAFLVGRKSTKFVGRF